MAMENANSEIPFMNFWYNEFFRKGNGKVFATISKIDKIERVIKSNRNPTKYADRTSPKETGLKSSVLNT